MIVYNCHPETQLRNVALKNLAPPGKKFVRGLWSQQHLHEHKREREKLTMRKVEK